MPCHRHSGAGVARAGVGSSVTTRAAGIVGAGVATRAADTRFLPRWAIGAILIHPPILEGVGFVVFIVAVFLSGVNVTLGPGLLEHVLEGDALHVALVVGAVSAGAVSGGAAKVHHMIVLVSAPV